MLGGLLMACGQLTLFASANVFSTDLEFARTLLYIALGIIIFGNGFFKPNISSMVGSLYTKGQKNKLDTAFTIFYMGINVGAFICNFFGAALQILLGWQYAFMAAGIGMFIGVIVFLLGTKH
jgi:POT family proton-dependent oligopeptide transporter